MPANLYQKNVDTTNSQKNCVIMKKKVSIFKSFKNYP